MGTLERFRKEAGRLNRARLFILDHYLFWRGELGLYCRRRRFQKMKARAEEKAEKARAKRAELQKELERALEEEGD